jgi:hypothetical protein
LRNFKNGLASAVPGNDSQRITLKVGAHIAISVVAFILRVDEIGLVPKMVSSPAKPGCVRQSMSAKGLVDDPDKYSSY